MACAAQQPLFALQLLHVPQVKRVAALTALRRATRQEQLSVLQELQPCAKMEVVLQVPLSAQAQPVARKISCA